jgi:hypothetical protein
VTKIKKFYDVGPQHGPDPRVPNSCLAAGRNPGVNVIIVCVIDQ